MISAHFNFATSHLTRNIAAASRSHAKAMESIATGYKINTAADGPADLIMSEKLRSQIDGLERAMRNTSESGNIMGIMEGALGQVQNIINRMHGLAVEAANSGITSPDRIAANQAEVDAGLQAINRIMETTRYGGRQLLGNMQNRGIINNNYESILEAGKHLRKNGGRIPDITLGENFRPGAISDTIVMLAENQEHAEQVSDDGKTLNGDKTFVLPPAEEGGEPTELTFAEGTSLDDIVAALRKHAATLPPQEGEFLSVGDTAAAQTAPGVEGLLTKTSFLGGRRGTDINTVELSAAQLDSFAKMSDEGAKSRLSRYMNNFTREIELDLDGWNALSDADQSLLLTADNMANLGMGDLAGVSDGSGGMLTLNDLYSGGKASLVKDPAKAIEILAGARDGVAAQRAQIGATQAMQQHGMNADAAALEANQRMESYLRDTRFDEAVVEMTRTEILQQTGTALLKKTVELYKSNMSALLDLTA